MKIHVTSDAANWYKEELGLIDGDNIRFYVRYGGCSSVQKGFSLGISKENPENELAGVDVENLHFYVEDHDGWYFENGTFQVELNESSEEPNFIVTKDHN